jgi:hypothetical protein
MIFLSYFKGPSSKDQQKTIRRRLITFKVTLTGCPESPEKGDPSTRELLRRADSTGPVSPTCNRFIRPKAGNAP